MPAGDRHRRQFHAYCDAIFDHRALLDEIETRYVEHAFAVARPDSADSLPISWKTYGHKIEAGRLAAFQLGLGFQTLSPADAEAIGAVLARWLGAGATHPYRDLLARSQGAGLAWVFPTGERRFYCFFREPDAAPDLRHRRDLAELCAPEFILGWTFRGPALIESKTYYYPYRDKWPGLLKAFTSDERRAAALAAEAARVALVVSRDGLPRIQFDVRERRQTAMLRTLGNTEAVCITRRCAAVEPPLQLDTVAVTSRGLGLYFD